MNDVIALVTVLVSVIAVVVSLITASGAVRKDAVEGLRNLVGTLQKELEIKNKLEKENDKEIEKLKIRIDNLEMENTSLRRENDELRETVKEQALEIGELQRRLDESEAE